jgi:hypothetical protein
MSVIVESKISSDMLLKVLTIISLVFITTALAKCKLVVYNEENHKGFHETLHESKLVSSIEVKSFHVHGNCKWAMNRVVQVE